MNEWHMALHRLLRDIVISTQAANPTPIITSLNAFTHDVDHFAAALYNIDGRLTALANDLISPTVPHPASAPAPGLAVLTLPPRVMTCL